MTLMSLARPLPHYSAGAGLGRMCGCSICNVSHILGQQLLAYPGNQRVGCYL